jgi:hypothetical protein
MKLELTNTKAWNKLSEMNIPMEHKIKVYEKLGGAYRLGNNGGEQVFNKLTELLKNIVNERLTSSKNKISEVETQDHEVSMSLGQLDDIIRNANELKGKIGTQEINLPGWIQDHISQSQNFINQANTGYHELKTK